ncbi:MAG TPA: VacJ family lipoprotein [Nitrospirales bacterium]|jgi:phospholipid-binding lipoprotein MlaA
MLNYKTHAALALIACIGTLGAGQLHAAETTVQPLEEVVVHDTRLHLDEVDMDDYDPWEPFNEKMFNFNYKVDRYMIKPVAKVYNEIVLDGEKQAIHNAYDNVAMPKRFVNSLLQGKFGGAGRELSRFLINSTLGVGGFADVAKYQFHMEKSDENTGRTFGHYGAGPGPYLVLPFLAPLTVRDAIGYAFDLALDPMSYALPLVGSFAKTTDGIVNTRARNLDMYESVEEATVDLYSAVRNATLTDANSRSHKNLSLPGSLLTNASSQPGLVEGRIQP